MSPEQFLYRVWLPGQAPTSHEPTLLLYSPDAVRFFVQSVTSCTSIFTGKAFAMAAYHVRNQLFERVVAEGTYQLGQWDGNGEPPLQVLYESGIRSGELNVISAALIDALAAIKKEQIR